MADCATSSGKDAIPDTQEAPLIVLLRWPMIVAEPCLSDIACVPTRNMATGQTDIIACWFGAQFDLVCQQESNDILFLVGLRGSRHIIGCSLGGTTVHWQMY